MASPPWFGSSSGFEVAVLEDILIDAMRFVGCLFVRELMIGLTRAVL